MKCSKCGKENPNDSKFCQYCGGLFERDKEKGNSKVIIIILIIILVCALVAGGIFLYLFFESRSTIAFLQNDLEKKTTECDKLLDDGMDSLEMRYALSNVVFVYEDVGDGMYHKYNCPAHSYIDESGTYYAYNSENAVEQGYKRCPICGVY